MKKMTVVDVVKVVYPGHLESGNIRFGCNLEGVLFITKWAVPNEPQPTIKDLEAQIPQLQNQFDIDNFIFNVTNELALYVDLIAQQKKYLNAVSCVSYINSTVEPWKSEALSFISWRDSVYKYVIEQIELIQTGQRTIPNFQDFKNELPVITWP